MSRTSTSALTYHTAPNTYKKTNNSNNGFQDNGHQSTKSNDHWKMANKWDKPYDHPSIWPSECPGVGSGRGPRQSSADAKVEELRIQGDQAAGIHMAERQKKENYPEKELRSVEVCPVYSATCWLARVYKETTWGWGRKNHSRGLEREHCLALIQSWEYNLFLPARQETFLINKAELSEGSCLSSKGIISPRLNLALVLPNKS